MALASNQVGSKKGGWNYDILKRPVDSNVASLISPSLFRLTEGIPQRELRQMVTEAKACEEALELEIKQLENALEQETKSSSSNKEKSSIQGGSFSATDSTSMKKSIVDIMIESEVTPPDRFFTISALLGRLRDDLATPLPPNSTLPALRSLHGLMQPPQKKKKTAAPSNNEAPGGDEKQHPVSKRLLELDKIPEYRADQENTSSLLALWKKISTHRTSVVFRRPVNPKEAPGYTDRIFFPMDLSLIRKMIVSRMIKSYADLHQWVGLICHNCVKYNGRESDYGLVTREFEAVVDEFMIAAVTAAGAATRTQVISSQGGASTAGNNQNVSAQAEATDATSANRSATAATPPAAAATSVVAPSSLSSASSGDKKNAKTQSNANPKKAVPMTGVTKTT